MNISNGRAARNSCREWPIFWGTAMLWSLATRPGPYYFAGVIVHETTHGFLHRYKSGQFVPSWLNEGIADWVAMTVVRSDNGVRNKVKAGLERMRRLGTLGGDFFTAQYIAREQYGMAVAIVDYLLRRNPKGFREMIEGIKGRKWQAASKKTIASRRRSWSTSSA